MARYDPMSGDPLGVAGRRVTTPVDVVPPPPPRVGAAPAPAPPPPVPPPFFPQPEPPPSQYTQAPSGWPSAAGGYQLEGFDWDKFANPAHQTLKYQAGRVLSQYAPTPAGMTQLMADPAFQALGIQSIGNGRFRLPDGTIIDAVRAWDEGGGGKAWQWGVETGPGGAPLPLPTQPSMAPPVVAQSQALPFPPLNPPTIPGPDTNVPPGIGIEPTDEFTDPTTANWERLLNSRILELQRGVADPSRQQYADLLQTYIENQGDADPILMDLVNALRGLATYQGQPGSGETEARRLAEIMQALDPTYAQQAEARVSALGAEPYTGAEWEMYRTAALDPIERDRQAAIRNALARISNQGIDQTSGIAQALIADVNRGFDASRAEEQGRLGRQRVETRDARQREAFDVQTALANMLQGRQLTGVNLLGEADATEQARRAGQAQTFGAITDVQQARTQQQLAAANELSSLSGSVRGEEEARRAQAIALQGLLAELPERRLQLALATLGQGEAPGSVMNSLLGLAGLGQQQAQFQSTLNQNFWQGLASMLSGLGQPEG